MSPSLYRVEINWLDKWHSALTENRSFCLGFAAAMREHSGPRSAFRVVRASDGEIIEEHAEQTEVGVGMIAGMVTAEQLEDAAAKALARAAKIREREARQAERESARRGTS